MFQTTVEVVSADELVRDSVVISVVVISGDSVVGSNVVPEVGIVETSVVGDDGMVDVVDPGAAVVDSDIPGAVHDIGNEEGQLGSFGWKQADVWLESV